MLNVMKHLQFSLRERKFLHFVTHDELAICRNRMSFPQKIGTQDDEQLSHFGIYVQNQIFN